VTCSAIIDVVCTTVAQNKEKTNKNMDNIGIIAIERKQCADNLVSIYSL